MTTLEITLRVFAAVSGLLMCGLIILFGDWDTGC